MAIFTAAASQLVTRSTRHPVDSSQTGGQLVTARGQFVTSKTKQTSKPYCRSSNYPYSAIAAITKKTVQESERTTK